MKKIFIAFLFFFIFQNSYSQLLKTLKEHNGTVNCIKFFNNNKYFVSGGDDENLIFWSTETLQKFHFEHSSTGDIIKISISPNDKWLVTGHKETFLKTVDKATNIETGNNKTFTLWDLSNYRENFTVDINRSLEGVVFSPFNGHVYYVQTDYSDIKRSTYNIYSYNKKFVDYDIDAAKLNFKDYRSDRFESKAKNKWESTSYGKYYDYFEIVDDENILNFSYGLELYNYKTGEYSKLSSKVEFDCKSIAVTSDGKKAAVANYDPNLVYIWDFNIMKSIKSLSGHTSKVLSVAISPDNKFVATGSKDETVKLWDISTGKCLKTLTGHNSNVTAVCFSPDGKYLVSGDDNGTIKVWDAISIIPDLKIYYAEYDLKFGIVKKINDEFSDQLKIINDNFQPKGEFETTDSYEARLKEKNDKIASINEFYRNKLTELQESQKQNLTELKDKKDQEINSTIEASTKDTTVAITSVGYYNADKQILQITIKGITYDVSIPISEAPAFKENWKKATVRCKKQLMQDLKSWRHFDFVIVNPVTKTEYQFGDKK